MGPNSFQWCPATGQEANSHKLKHRKFHLNMRKSFGVTEHWNGLPRGVVESLSLEKSRTGLDMVQCNLL